jgi:AraC-like DNA-binding protein
MAEGYIIVRWKSNQARVLQRKQVSHIICLTFLLHFFLSFESLGQLTIVIDRLPANTPQTDTLFLAGNFNNWDPSDEKHIFRKGQDGRFSISLMVEPYQQIQYKVTRGSWKKVEGDTHGNKMEDRIFQSEKKGPWRIEAVVLSWEDLKVENQWRVFVHDIPKDTPMDGQIYISGNFNGWKENDAAARLLRFSDGAFGITLPKTTDTLVYKFTRGSWNSVETRENGKAQFNRVTVWDKKSPTTTVKCSIAGWQDMSSGSNLFFSFAFLTATFVACFLALCVSAVKDAAHNIRLPLVLILVLTAVATFARTAVYNKDLFQAVPALLFLSDIAYFLYAPLFYLLFRSVFGTQEDQLVLKWLVPGVAIVQLAVYLPMAAVPAEELIQALNDQRYRWTLSLIAVIALLYNGLAIGYVAKSFFPILRQRKEETKERISYIGVQLLVLVLCYLLWISAASTVWLGVGMAPSVSEFSEILLDFAWILFSSSVFVHAYFVITAPQLFRPIREEAVERSKAYQRENMDELKRTLAQLMKKEKPYLNPKLTLQDLADMMKMNVHTLSWLINEGYGKNFFDFINEYRIEEFKRLVAEEQNKNFTFLAMALEAGFSSKTTFNRSFKKSTGQTPREYFQLQESSVD